MHVPLPSQRVAPLVLPTAELRHALPFSPHHAKPPLAMSPAGQELAAMAARQPLLRSAPPEPLPLATCPLEQRELIRKRVRSTCHRHVALATEWRSPATLSAATVGTDPDRLFKEPRARLRTQAVPSHLPRTPIGSQSTRGGLLPHLRQPQPPPLPQPFRHHQGLPLSILFTRNLLILP